jgi:hypothetical protein
VKGSGVVYVQTNEERAAIKKMAEQNKGLFTIQAMWEAMPLDMYCQIVGNSNRHPAILNLFDKGLTMGVSPHKPPTQICPFSVEQCVTGTGTPGFDPVKIRKSCFFW